MKPTSHIVYVKNAVFHAGRMTFSAKHGLICKDLLQMFKKLSDPLSLLSKLNNMAKLVAENGLGLNRADNSIDKDRKY